LKLLALDATDIALSKLERNAERDREDVLCLARAGYIDPQVLKDRLLRGATAVFAQQGPMARQNAGTLA